MAYDDRIRTGMGIRTFMALRLIRLYPLYILAVAISVIYYAGHGLSWPSAIASLAFVPNVLAPNFSWFVGPTWSLFFELVANLLFVALHRHLTTRTLLAIVGCAFVALVWSAVQFRSLDFGWRADNVVGGFPRVLFGFPLGVLLFRFRDRLLPTGALPPVATWIVAALLIVVLLLPAPRFTRVALDLALVLLVFPAIVLVASRAKAGADAAVLFGLGAASYAIFVLHAPVLRLAGRTIERSHRGYHVDALLGLGLIALLVLGCIVLDHFFDSPVRRYLKRRLLGG